MSTKQKTISGFKIVSEDQLEAAFKHRKQIVKRLIVAGSLAAVSLALLIIACLPLILNQMMPLLWVNEADHSGLTKNLHEIGLRLLANGRIQTLHPAFSWVFAGLALFSLWFTQLVFLNRKESKWFGTAFSRSYWTSFYLVRSNVTVHRVKSRVALKHNVPARAKTAKIKVSVKNHQ